MNRDGTSAGADGRGRRIAFRAILVLIPVLASLALGEALVRIVAPQDLSGSWFRLGPRGLVMNKAHGTVRHQLGDRVVHYRFNSFHQRGAEPLPGVPAVLVIGDSFSFGWLLPEPYSIAALLQARADADLGPGTVQFLNGATGGWGIDSFLAYLESFGERIAPVAVLVMVNATDFGRASRNRLYGLAENDRGELVPRDASDTHPLGARLVKRIPLYDWLISHSHLMQLLRRIYVSRWTANRMLEVAVAGVTAGSGVVAAPEGRERQLGTAILESIVGWCRRRGIALFVSTAYRIGYEDGVYRWIGDVLDPLAVPFLDTEAAIATAVGGDRGSFFVENDGHPNERLNTLIADRLWSWLQPRLVDVVR